MYPEEFDHPMLKTLEELAGVMETVLNEIENRTGKNRSFIIEALNDRLGRDYDILIVDAS